ncbi:FecCD family ABC transporter permease [Marinicella sediminis]|uniref:FecCD family ABC transporter permease n=1 Tax=Marinicella sediminis TaxID=1792834 RepID=UPI001E4E9B06|nr:iron ABC transporter permease [Marinicella sediminis]
MTDHWASSIWFWLVLLLVLMTGSLLVGSVTTNISQLWQPDAPQFAVVWELRFPRVINAVVVGACLSVAGLLIQNLVKNPLADPYLLGVSGGAATVQLLVIMMGLSLSQSWLFLSGFLGSLLATVLLLKLSYLGELRPNKLTLNGVVLAFGFAAVISFVLSTAQGQQIKSMMFWLMGDLSFARPSLLMVVLGFLACVWLYRHARSLDVLARGDLFAAKSGVAVKKMNLWVFVLTALLTSMAVAQAGTIGFVGLIIPHLVRMLVGHRHRDLIPMCLLVGGCFLLLADTLARTVLSPVQLPVGVFTAIIGVPVFLWLNRKV